MRPSIIPTLLVVPKKSNAGIENLSFFEVGPILGINQTNKLAQLLV